MFLWVARPHLMSTFEHSIVGFGTSRELRSLDAEIKLYKLQTIIAEAVPKRYESFDLDMVSYHGAYIRTMTLMCVEGIVKNHVIALKEGLSSPQIEMTTNVLENIIRQLILSLLHDRRMDRSEQPWSDGFRLKMRTWQFLLIMIQLLDNSIYTPAFRQARVESTGEDDILNMVMANLWLILKEDCVPAIRQYMEIYTIKFMLSFPDVAIEGENFSKVLLDPKKHKAQISASLLIVSGFILVSNLETPNAVNFKRKIYDQMLGFCTSNSAHSRCIAQYFIMRL